MAAAERRAGGIGLFPGLFILARADPQAERPLRDRPAPSRADTPWESAARRFAFARLCARKRYHTRPFRPARKTRTPKPSATEIRTALEQALAPLSIEVIDDSARHAGHAGAREGGHYRVTLVARAFAGRPQLERHRMVYSAVAPLMGRGIHALSIVAHAPHES